MESLESKDQVILVAALANEQWTAPALSRELKARGIAVSEKPIMFHRKKECSCLKT